MAKPKRLTNRRVLANVRRELGLQLRDVKAAQRQGDRAARLQRENLGEVKDYLFFRLRDLRVTRLRLTRLFQLALAQAELVDAKPAANVDGHILTPHRRIKFPAKREANCIIQEKTT